MKASPKAFSSTIDTGIPTGYSYFPKEVTQLPRRSVGSRPAFVLPQMLIYDTLKQLAMGAKLGV